MYIYYINYFFYMFIIIMNYIHNIIKFILIMNIIHF